MKILVMGSCTGEKDLRDCPGMLTSAEFGDQTRLQLRESELSAWALPASKLYTGWQHRYMMNGVSALRHRFGDSVCSVKIISAGYGLVDEEQSLVPYEVTFHGQQPRVIRSRSEVLGIPVGVRNALAGYDLVMFLLGKEYLLSIGLPLSPALNQRLVFLTSNVRFSFHPASVMIPAGKEETRFGAGIVSLKGKMFERFALGLCNAPEKWDRVLSDKTAWTVLELIEAGGSQR